MDISQDAFDLIVREEDSDAGYYTRHYQHFDWPAGASGPTVGIGYDCGYVTTAECAADWNGIVSSQTIAQLVLAVGLKGGAAAQFVRTNRAAVTITWDQAIKEFSDRELPKWVAHVRAALPNFDKLSLDSRGALVSLAYNRGCSFNLPGPRFAEMRAIRMHMAAGAYNLIPADIRSMQRLWPQGGDLWKRREHEAALFQKGLAS